MIDPARGRMYPCRSDMQSARQLRVKRQVVTGRELSIRDHFRRVAVSFFNNSRLQPSRRTRRRNSLIYKALLLQRRE